MAAAGEQELSQMSCGDFTEFKVSDIDIFSYNPLS